MNNPFTRSSRLLLLAALPAALLTTSCGSNDDDNPVTPVQDKGRVLVSHAAASAAVPVRVLVNDAEVVQLNYGQTSSYLDVNTGSPTLKVNVTATNATAAQQAITVEKDKNYSVFAYPLTATTSGLLSVTDDLTAPASGQAKIRVVHLGLGAPATVKISQSTIAGPVDLAGASTGFGAASAFVNVPFNAAGYNLVLTSGSTSTTVANVGDGSGNTPGSVTGSKVYEAGKIYTIVLRGNNSSLDPNLALKATVVQHN